MKKIILYPILLLVFLIITIFIAKVFITSTHLYAFEFNRLGIENTVFDRVGYTQNIIDFLYHKTNLSSTFTPSEISHMNDVRAIIDLFVPIVIILFCIILTLIIIFKKQIIKLIYKEIIKSNFQILALTALVTLFSIIFFDSFFIKFHLLTFSNDLWLLPKDSLLIKLFPEIFFRDFFIFIATASIAIDILVTFGLSILFKRFIINFKKEKNE